MSFDNRTDQEIMASLPTEAGFTHSVRTAYLFRFEVLQRDLMNFVHRVEPKLDAVIAEAESNKKLKRALFRTAAVVGALISFIVAVADNIWAMVTR